MTFYQKDRERALLYLTKLMDKGKPVKIEPITESKTLSQNAYIWLVFTHVAFETGSDKNYMYHLFLKRFPVFMEGKNLSGDIELVPATLSGFSKEQTSWWIDQIVTTLRSEGFDVPDPEDKRALEMYQYYKEKGMI